MEKDSVTCPVKLKTTYFKLGTVDNECSSCDLVSASEAQSLLRFNTCQEDPQPYQFAESPPDDLFSSSDPVALTALLIQKMYLLKVIKEAVPQLSRL